MEILNLLYAVAAVVVTLVGVLWFILPFVLIDKLNKLIAGVKAVEDQVFRQNYATNKERRSPARTEGEPWPPNPAE